jgi:hypothetical protein
LPSKKDANGFPKKRQPPKSGKPLSERPIGSQTLNDLSSGKGEDNKDRDSTGTGLVKEKSANFRVKEVGNITLRKN